MFDAGDADKSSSPGLADSAVPLPMLVPQRAEGAP